MQGKSRLPCSQSVTIVMNGILSNSLPQMPFDFQNTSMGTAPGVVPITQTLCAPNGHGCSRVVVFMQYTTKSKHATILTAGCYCVSMCPHLSCQDL
jgi:hypothetical protein